MCSAQGITTCATSWWEHLTVDAPLESAVSAVNSFPDGKDSINPERGWQRSEMPPIAKGDMMKVTV